MSTLLRPARRCGVVCVRSQRVLKTFLFVVVSALLPWLPARPARSASSAAEPNILVILADDLGYGDLSSYGATDLRTPHLDGLIAAGMRFDTFYANCPVCSPTRAALLTGRYQELVGVPGVIRTREANSWGWLDPQAILLPKLLKQAGYRTAIFGKWHLGLDSPNLPNERGFDHFQGFLGDMMDDYFTHRRHGINYMRFNRKTIDPQGHATDLFTQWACQYIRSNSDQDQPFFIYLAYNAPHTPIQPPTDWLEKVHKREPDISEKRAKLVALIEHLDDGVGRVLQTLQATGAAERTVVFFTSDNGGQLEAGANNGTLRDGKQSMYEGGLRVPAGVCWPGRIAAGSRGIGNWLTMDIFATVCELAHLPVEHKIEGQSFLPMLLGKPQTPAPRDLFFHRREGGLRYAGLTIEAVRRGPWKLLRNTPFSPFELYNLDTDPREQQNVVDARPRIYHELAAALRWQNQRGGAVPWQPPARRDADRPSP